MGTSRVLIYVSISVLFIFVRRMKWVSETTVPEAVSARIML